jgi:hypothetical protein
LSYYTSTRARQAHHFLKEDVRHIIDLISSRLGLICKKLK